MLPIDKDKYIQIARTEGPNAAITALHKDTNLIEIESSEGKAGWDPELFEQIKKIRDFSRELWDAAVLQSEAEIAAEALANAPFESKI